MSLATRKGVFDPSSIDWSRAPGLIGMGGLILLIALLLLVSIVFPVIPALATLLLVFLVFRSKAVAAFGVTLVVFLFFGWMNSEKALSGDWAWYTHHNFMLQYVSYLDYLGSQFGVIRIKASEPVYHFISFVTARLSGGNSRALAWVVTAFIYLQLGAALAILFGRHARSNIEIASAIFVALLVGITFTLTTQLVRQELAAAFIVLGWAFWIRQWKIAAIVWLLLGLFSHNSSVAPALTVFTAALLCTTSVKARFWGVPFTSLLFVATGYFFIHYAGEGGLYTVGKSDGEISIYVHIFDVFVFLTFLKFRKALPEISKLSSIIAITWVLYVCFLIGAYSEPLPFLRMYFYIEMLRMVMLAGIVLAMFRSRAFFWGILPLLILSIVYVEVRLMTSPFWYRGGILGHLLRPFALWH